MKTVKLALMNNNEVVEVRVDPEYAKEIESDMQARGQFICEVNMRTFSNFDVDDTTQIIDMTGKHLCPYCHGIASGTDTDVLCDDCRMTFGHAFFSEL